MCLSRVGVIAEHFQRMCSWRILVEKSSQFFKNLVFKCLIFGFDMALALQIGSSMNGRLIAFLKINCIIWFKPISSWP